MRSRFPSPRALLGAVLLVGSLGGCGFGRNVSADCWIDQGNYQSAERFRTSLRQRNLAIDDPVRLASLERSARARKALRACQDDVPALGRPLGGAPAAAHAPAEGGHGA